MSANPAPDSPPKSWDRQPGEPAAAYARFLIYRNLGPGRTLNAAYWVYTGAPEGTARRPAPGSWHRDSAMWNWPSRASDWDVTNLWDMGREIVITYFAAYKTLTDRTLETLTNPDTRPANWRDVLETLSLLDRLVTPEQVKRVVDGEL